MTVIIVVIVLIVFIVKPERGVSAKQQTYSMCAYKCIFSLLFLLVVMVVLSVISDAFFIQDVR